MADLDVHPPRRVGHVEIWDDERDNGVGPAGYLVLALVAFIVIALVTYFVRG